MSIDVRLALPAAGAWLAAALGVGLEPRTCVWTGAAGALAAAALAAGRWRRRHLPGLIGVGVLLLACTAAVLLSVGVQGVSRGWLRGDAEVAATVLLEGSVRSGATSLQGVGPTRFHVTVEARQALVRGAAQRIRGPVTVVGGQEWSELGYGTVVRVEGRLDLRGDDIVLRAKNGPEILQGPSPAVVARIHRALLAATHDLSPQARGLVPGIALGNTSRIDAGLADDMRTTSLTHITAVSGSHFAIVISVVGGMTASAGRPVRALVAAGAMVGFVFLVYPQPSVLRAAAMGAVGVWAMTRGRPSKAVAALGTAVIVLVVLDPWLARTYGFVLSVLATAGLAVGAPVVARWLAPWCGRTIAMAVAIPIAAQAAVAPVLVLLDPSLTLYAVPANLLAAPALAPATILGVCAALIAPIWPWLAEVLATVAGYCTGWIAGVAHVLADLPGARIPWIEGPFGVGALAMATVAVAWVVARWRRTELPPADLRAVCRTAGPWRAAVAGVSVLVVVVALCWGLPWARRQAAALPDDWTVAACDVGQGDALAVRSGPMSVVLVDVGPDPESVKDCLDDLGVEQIDLLVLTHYHADHIGGLDGVLDRPIAGALVPGSAGQPATARGSTVEELARAGITTVTALTGMSGTVGSASWEVLQAADPHTRPAREHGDESVANDAGVVVRFDVGDLSTVVLGDLEERGQRKLATAIRESVDVVKIAHHGSASQSPRLARVLAARVALVSVGENPYGHPTARSLELYEAYGAAIVRTDRCGTVAVLIGQDGLAVAGCE